MSLDYRPGDIVDGHVLGSDNAWHDLAGAEPGEAAEPATAPSHQGGNRGALIVLLIVLAIVAAAGVGLIVLLIGGSGAGTDPSPGAEDGAAQAPDDEPLLEVGDCLRGPFDGDDADALGVVACSVAHRGEVVFLDQEFYAAEESMPSMQQIERRALVACESAVANYTGEPFMFSPYSFWYFAPSEWTWMQGDRGLLCVATTMSDDWAEDLVTTGSIASGDDLQAQGSARE